MVCINEFLDVGVLAIQACNIAGIDCQLITPQHLRSSLTPVSCQAHATALSCGRDAREAHIVRSGSINPWYLSALPVIQHVPCRNSISHFCFESRGTLACRAVIHTTAGTACSSGHAQQWCQRVPESARESAHHNRSIMHIKINCDNLIGSCLTFATASRFWGSKLTQR